MYTYIHLEDTTTVRHNLETAFSKDPFKCNVGKSFGAAARAARRTSCIWQKYMYMYVWMHTHTHADTHISTHPDAHRHTDTQTNTHTHTHTHMCTIVYILHMYMHLCVHVCVCICIILIHVYDRCARQTFPSLWVKRSNTSQTCWAYHALIRSGYMSVQ